MAASEDEVIEDGAIERFGGGGEAASGAAVGIAGPGVAARVIVCQHDSRAMAFSGIGDDFAKREHRAAFVAPVARDMDAACLIVDVSHPQALHRRITVGKAACKELLGGGEAVKFQR